MCVTLPEAEALSVLTNRDQIKSLRQENEMLSDKHKSEGLK
jgi:hypothetical protein